MLSQSRHNLVLTQVLCGYAGDGGTSNKVCEDPAHVDEVHREESRRWFASCIPGCTSGHPPSANWCNPAHVDSMGVQIDACTWKPDELSGMLLQQSSPSTRTDYVSCMQPILGSLHASDTHATADSLRRVRGPTCIHSRLICSAGWARDPGRTSTCLHLP